jgi:hypothetical protein
MITARTATPQSACSSARSGLLRKLVGTLLAAGAIAAVAAAPVAADLEFCLTDPAVVVNGTTIQVGLYTHDANLAAPGGIPQSAPIRVTLLGSRSGTISTDSSAWQVKRANTSVTVLNALPGNARSATEPVEIDAFVPSSLRRDTYYIKVTMPDGSVKTASAPVNHLARLRVEVPVSANNGADHGGSNG